ncbi:MAG: DUF1727 domain-containing protein [Aeriscardovia sp.]|nr:DUF1727 domain-containing protein [Aeriscardovia sp.]
MAAGKGVQKACRLLKRGHSLPGMIVEKMDKGFLASALGQLPLGTMIVCGTNGKTTTARLISQALKDLGLKVVTNDSGANFTRGIISSLLPHITPSGKLPCDIGIFELDEAWAPVFCRQFPPSYALILNCSRDQLDRYGERDSVESMLAKVASSATRGLILNGGDERVRRFSSLARGAKVSFYDFDPAVASLFPRDEDLICMRQGVSSKAPDAEAAVVLKGAFGDRASFEVAGKEFSFEMGVEGSFNFLNAAAAIAGILNIEKCCPEIGKEGRFKSIDLSPKSVAEAVSKVKPAFGRGEEFRIRGSKVKMVLVKNPVGFSSALRAIPLQDRDVMVALNDESADGRDVSWIYDVDYSNLSKIKDVTGERAFDMALCLEYNGKDVRKADLDMSKSLSDFLEGPHDKVIFSSYTSMLSLRKILLEMDKSKGGDLYAAD